MLYKMIISAGILSSASLLIGAEDSSSLMSFAFKSGRTDASFGEYVINLHKQLPLTLPLVQTPPQTTIHSPAATTDQLLRTQYSATESKQKLSEKKEESRESDLPMKPESDSVIKIKRARRKRETDNFSNNKVKCVLCGFIQHKYGVGRHMIKHGIKYDKYANPPQFEPISDEEVTFGDPVSRRVAKRHKVTMTPNSPAVECEYCHTVLKWASSLRIHMKKHGIVFDKQANPPQFKFLPQADEA